MPNEIEILSETTLAAIPRGKREELRVSFTRGRVGDRETTWHSLRVWWCLEGEKHFRPGKAGCTIRAGELRQVIDALSSIVDDSKGPPRDERVEADIPF
jgi:hypothetical protein